MLIERSIELDYGHTLPNHYSFCNQLHGHRAKVEALIEGDICDKIGDSSEGMVLDFKILKEAMMTKIHNVLDHGFAVWEKDIEDLEFITKRNKKYLITTSPPTAEYLAKWAYNQLVSEISHPLKLIQVRWFETPNSVATYTIDNFNNDVHKKWMGK
jgi:6-pyruvoyltetrahydropterin/6-carboxytetrahydropterin synthase